MTKKRAGRPPRDPVLKAALTDLIPRILQDIPGGMTARELRDAAAEALERDFDVGAVASALHPMVGAGQIERRQMVRETQPSRAPMIYTLAAAPDQNAQSEDAARREAFDALMDRCIEEQRRKRAWHDRLRAALHRSQMRGHEMDVLADDVAHAAEGWS